MESDKFRHFKLRIVTNDKLMVGLTDTGEDSKLVHRRKCQK